MPIYTRTGDKGLTSLFNGQRVSKADLRVEAYGTIDELNSAIGLVISEIQNSKGKSQNYSPRSSFGEAGKSKLKSELTAIQNDLFEIGSTLASTGIRNQELGPRQLGNPVKNFENLIDEMTKQMPPLVNFILPGGGKTGALLHFARTVARRAERKIVRLNEQNPIDKNMIMYLNRLSDILFTMSRYINYKEKQKEIIWVRKSLRGVPPWRDDAAIPSI